MKKECGCGCGMKLGWANRKIAQQSAALQEQVDYLKAVPLQIITQATTFEEATDFRRFIQEGRNFSNATYLEAHGTKRPGSGYQDMFSKIDRRQMNAWSKAAAGIVAGTQQAVLKGALQSEDDSQTAPQD